MLLQHRDAKAPTNPNKWGLWGGGIEQQETPRQALVRELKEELDIDVSENDFASFKTYKERRFGDNWEGYIYILHHRNDFKYTLQEGQGLQFHAQDAIEVLNTDPIASFVLTDFFKDGK